MGHDHDQREVRPVRRTSRSNERGPGSGPAIGNRAISSIVHRNTTWSQGAGPLDPELGAQINAARSGGSPLSPSTRIDMEHHLGVDLSAVRIHADARADQLSRSVQAEAFTTGTDIFFRQGVYQPQSAEGRRILGHELTHVIQQTTGAVGGENCVSHPSDPHEVEASRVAEAIARSPVYSGSPEFDDIA